MIMLKAAIIPAYLKYESDFIIGEKQPDTSKALTKSVLFKDAIKLDAIK